jgi:hypothetical protein
LHGNTFERKGAGGREREMDEEMRWRRRENMRNKWVEKSKCPSHSLSLSFISSPFLSLETKNKK